MIFPWIFRINIPFPIHRHDHEPIKIERLPQAISFSTLTLPFGSASSGDEPIRILRRDLFDARFQVLDEDQESDSESEADSSLAPTEPKPNEPSQPKEKQERNQQQYIDADTDLIPWTYEGGLKTWEGGMDLVQVLSSVGGRGLVEGVKGKKVLEVSKGERGMGELNKMEACCSIA